MRASAEAPLPTPATAGIADLATWCSVEERQAAARETYRSARRRGEVLTGAQIGSRYRMSERWGRSRIAEVRAEVTGNGSADHRSTPRQRDHAGNSGALPNGNDPIPSSRTGGNHCNDAGGNLSAAAPDAGNGRTAPQRSGSGNPLATASRNAGNGKTALPHGLSTNGSSRQSPTTLQDVAVRVATVDRPDDCAITAATDDASPAPITASAAQRRVTTLAVVVVATVAAAASYDHQRALAELAGEGWRSWLLPFSVDGLLTAATMLMLTRRRAGEPAGSLTWISLGLGIVASVAANVVGADPTLADPVLVGRLVAAWPPLALFLSLELLMRQLGLHHERAKA